MAAFDPRGAWTALVTPFTESGDFDAQTYERLVEFQLAEGVNGLVPCGTTGESPTLTWEEQGEAVSTAVRLARGRAQVLAGAGSNNTSEAVAGTRDAALRGVDAVLLVDCYYNGPSSLELRTEYYERILAEVPTLPIVPYVIPGRTGCSLSPADLAMLHQQHPERVPAVKSATGDFEHMRLDRSLAGPSLAILSGDDDHSLQMMRDPTIAASGVISVMSNIAPGAIASLCRASSEDSQEATRLEHCLAPLFARVTCKMTNPRTLPSGKSVTTEDRFRNPVPVKTMMAGLGMLNPKLRPPLGKMTAPAVQACRDALRQVHELDVRILSPIEPAFDVSIEQRLADDAVWAALAR
jgi:4-hydroxy-tetrahydrodipicolinate synthase